MAKRDDLRALYDLADADGHDVTQSTTRDHIRLIDGRRQPCEEQERPGAAFS